MREDWTECPESGCDRISALPDEVIHHLLGFLPAHDSVRTSLLARGWRNHWKSVRRLDIEEWTDTIAEVDRFVNHLLLQRRDPLDKCFIYMYGIDERHIDEFRNFETWIRHSVSVCYVRHLQAGFTTDEQPCLVLAGEPLLSEHLVRLELYGLCFEDSFLDFDKCAALEHLDIEYSYITVTKISCQSLKRLRIAHCEFFEKDSPTYISTPNIISLTIDSLDVTYPLLQSMTLLETAFVRLDFGNYNYEGQRLVENVYCCGDCEDCSHNDHDDRCMLLGGLSSAKHLELIGPTWKLTELRCCPIFGKLKTLFLNDWCVDPDVHALICILQHSPVLERLTIRLVKQCKDTTNREGNYHTEEQVPAVSEHLRLVKIICFNVDEKVRKLLKSLSASHIQIDIQQSYKGSEYSFVGRQYYRKKKKEKAPTSKSG